MSAIVSETFFALEVGDMERAKAFYVGAFGAQVMAALPFWTSLRIAGVRIGLFPNAAHAGTRRTGLHFVVGDLAAAGAEIERAGGRVVTAASEVAPGVIVADVMDTEGNVIALRA